MQMSAVVLGSLVQYKNHFLSKVKKNILKHQIYQSCTAEFTLTMSTQQSTYLAKITERSQTAVKSRTRASWQTQSFLHFFAVVLGAFRVGKSIVLLDPILSKGSRTIFGKRPFSKPANVSTATCPTASETTEMNA